MRLLILGDTHGNGPWLRDYVYPLALRLRIDAILQLGDFGFWEHMPAGVEYLDLVSQLACDTGIPMYALRGNHDKSSLVLERYGDKADPQGFIPVRDGVYYIPDGLVWEWPGSRFRAFGGAYSVDKEYRLDAEARAYEKAARKEAYRRQAGAEPKPIPSTAGTLWFPEEEMTDADMDRHLANWQGPVDVIVSHDKPRASNPHWNRKDFPECLPNQDRLQRAALHHQPGWWLHGHLHVRYTDEIRVGGDDKSTVVVGLAPDREAAELRWRPTDSWCVLSTTPERRVLLDGADAEEILAQEAA